MADNSILSNLISGFSDILDSAEAVGQGMGDEARVKGEQLNRMGLLKSIGARTEEVGDVIGQGVEDFGTQLQFPADVIDAISQRLTGSPLLFSRDETGNMFSSVSPGVSEGEMLKSGAKLAEQQANLLAMQAMSAAKKQSTLEKRLEELRAASVANPENVYVSQGNKILGGEKSVPGPDLPEKGSFSKTGKGYETPDEATIRKAIAAKKAETDYSQEIESNKSPGTKLRELILDAAKSPAAKDPATFKQILSSLLLSQGYTPEQVSGIINSRALSGK